MQSHRTARTQPAEIEIAGVSKRFGGALALEGVSLTIKPGQVHALIGENGAGKSTLGKIISGVLSPDEGQLLIGGQPVSFRSPREAINHGIVTIAQELAIVPGLSVAENVLLGDEPNAGGFVRKRAVRRHFSHLAIRAGFDLQADQMAGSLNIAGQQKVEILRALSRNASLIIMDEPTAALSSTEAKTLHNVIRTLASNGQAVFLISHFLSEVLELSDMITTLRDGRLVRSVAASVATEESLIEGMLGRSLGSAYPEKHLPASDSPILLSATKLSAPQVNAASLDVRAGEIVGLAGLVGSGRSEFARAIFQDAKTSSGSVTLRGSILRSRSPKAAIRRGLAMLPESRKELGLFLGRSIQENVTLSSLETVSKYGWILPRRERRTAAEVLERVTARGANFSAPVSALSGGNQQKVLFARMVLCKPKVLIADEPTRGVDVGSKRAIYDLLSELAQSGLAVIVISSDLEEVLGLAHRVLVMRSGRVVAELAGSQMTQQAVLESAFAEPTRNEGTNS